MRGQGAQRRLACLAGKELRARRERGSREGCSPDSLDHEESYTLC